MLIDITDTVQLTHTAAEVDADIDGSVRGDIAQLKDDTWKEQARENIGAGTGSGSGGGRNLLDNPFFTVNQRNASGLLTTTGYFVDRWKNDTANKVTVNGSTVILSAGGQISQYYENIILEVGKTYTFSVLTDSGVIYSWTKVYEDVETFRFVTLTPWEIGFIKSSKRLYIYNDTGVSIKAVKIELGEKSELANDAPPNFVEELRKCQYYFYALPGIAGVQCDAAAINTIYIDAFLPIEMRPVDPAVTFANLKVYNGNAITNVLGYKRGVGEQLRFQSTGLVAGQIYFVVQEDGTIPKIWVSADL